MTRLLDTSMNGTWVLELPSGATSLHVRCFTRTSRLPIPQAESSADAIRRAAIEAISLNNGEDELEQAWRALNGIGANESRPEVKDVLKSPCAVVTAGSDGGGRRLWLFEVKATAGTDQYSHTTLDGLTREYTL